MRENDGMSEKEKECAGEKTNNIRERAVKNGAQTGIKLMLIKLN